MIMLSPYDCAAADLPDLAFCWACNLQRRVVEFNPRTRRGLCGACKSIIFQGRPMHAMSTEERKARQDKILAPLR
jgi:hypothetical protein